MQGKSTIPFTWSRGLRPGQLFALAALPFMVQGTAAAAGPRPGNAGSPAVPGVLEVGTDVEPGAWARYTFINSSGQVALVRLAALEREGDARWFEIGITDDKQRRMVYRLLIRSGADASGSTVVRAIVQPPLQRPLILPESLARRQTAPVVSGRYGRSSLVRRGVVVKTTAGTFRTSYHRHRGKDDSVEEAWLTDGAAWPLVKYRSRRAQLELVGHGSDAESQIRGRPVKLDPRLLRDP